MVSNLYSGCLQLGDLGVIVSDLSNVKSASGCGYTMKAGLDFQNGMVWQCARYAGALYGQAQVECQC
jgi:hypothetical protein